MEQWEDQGSKLPKSFFDLPNIPSFHRSIIPAFLACGFHISHSQIIEKALYYLFLV
jgi:hypothetical protein